MSGGHTITTTPGFTTACVTHNMADAQNNSLLCGAAEPGTTEMSSGTICVPSHFQSEIIVDCDGKAPVADNLNSWLVIRLAARALHRTHKREWRGEIARLMPTERKGKQEKWVYPPVSRTKVGTQNQRPLVAGPNTNNVLMPGQHEFGPCAA